MILLMMTEEQNVIEQVQAITRDFWEVGWTAHDFQQAQMADDVIGSILTVKEKGPNHFYEVLPLSYSVLLCTD